MIEVETQTTEVEVINNVEVTSTSQVEIETVDLSDLDITVAKKEYVITGDNIYIPMLYDDAPQWMKDLVQVVVDVSISSGNQSLINNMNAILQDFAVSYVPLNQYTQSILDLGDEDTRLNGLIETLNSNFNDGLSTANAQIISLQLTKASKDEVVAQVIQTIAAQLADGASNIGSTIGRIDQAIANETSARATSFQVLTSSLEDTNLDVTANATATSALNTYVGLELGTPNGTGLLADVEILQKQNDGVIETTTGTYDVMISPENPDLAQLVVTAEPYATWKASDVTGMDTRLSHIGDVYVKYADTANGAKEYIASYKFIRTVIDNTSPYATDIDGFTWALIVDQVAQDAYEQALNAYDLADNKRRVFVATPLVPYDIGDLWLVQTGAGIIGTTQGSRVIQVGDMLRCAETKTGTGLYEHNDWIPADSYREGMNAIQTDLNSWRTGTYAPFVTSIQSQVDGKAETFYQNSVPIGRIKSTNVANNTTLNKYVGDLWKNTYAGTISGYLGDNTEYIYTKIANGSNWNYDWTKMEVPDIVFDTIDTKKSIYSGNSIPVAVAPDVIEVNDMWITGADVIGFDKESIYIWNGSAWTKPLKYTDDTAVTALETGLADGTTTIKLTSAFIGDTALTDYIVNEVDSKVGVYSGTAAPVNGSPSGALVNDIYIWFTIGSKVLANGTTQTYDINKTYKYSGTVWNEITTNSNITALADLADGKRTVFSGNVVPTGAVARDLWIPSATNGSYLQGEIYQYNGTSWVIATKYSSDIAALSSSVQTQIDSKVDTYYQAGVPFANATNVAKIATAGDYWYCTQDGGIYLKGKIYKYVESANGSNYNYTWTLTTDISRDAFDLADGKSTIYTTASQPTKYNMNDMMIVVSSFNNGTTTFSDGVVLTATVDSSSFVASHWVKKINDTEDLDAYINVVNPQLTSLQNQVDGKIESWYTISTNDPKTAWADAETRAKHDGDMWYQIDTKLSYYYSSGTNSWNLIDDAKAIQALEDAATAQATADGKISSYYMSTLADAQTMSSGWTATEKTNNVGDLVVVWNDTTLDNNGTWRWNGTSWVTTRDKKLVALASDVTALSTELDNGTNTWASADSTLENSLLTEISDEGARVESKFAYNSLLNINGIYKKSGFGLTTNYVSGSGTQIDPYVSEFWIDASRLKFTNSNVTGSVAPFTIDASGATPQITFNGKVTFSNVTNTTGTGSNLLYNSAPKIGSETKGWYVWTNSGMIVNLSAGFDIWKPTGGASVAASITGNPSIGSVYDVGQSLKFPVIAGSRYEASAYISAHRSNSHVNLIFYDTSGTYIGESQGNVINYAGSNALVNWGRSSVFTTAPGNAATALLTIRSIVTGTDPFCFAANAFAGVAEANQTTPSNWSEGTSAGATYTSELSNDAGYVLPAGVANAINTNTTTINGSKITTGSIVAAQINVTDLFSKNITYTGVITGGNVAGGGIIRSYNGNMTIDLVNGSIYIA